MVTSVLASEDSGSSIGNAIIEAVRSLVKYIGKSEIDVRTTAPLINFDSEIWDVELFDGLYLRRTTVEDLRFYFGFLHDHFDRFHLNEIRFQLEHKSKAPRSSAAFPDGGGLRQIKFQKAELTLRLLKAGALGMPILTEAFETFGGHSSTGLVSAKPFNYFGVTSPYLLAAHDLDSARKLRSQLSTFTDDDRFKLATRRLAQSYRENLPDDRLLDYWIAIESLLLPDGKDGELSFRAALRLAWMVAEPKDRKALFKKVRDSYKLRSVVIHGTPLKTAEKDLLQDTEDFLRRIMQISLHMGHTPDAEWFNSLTLGIGLCVSCTQLSSRP
jgi:hypothetical protein